jgi:hypothetical protein
VHIPPSQPLSNNLSRRAFSAALAATLALPSLAARAALPTTNSPRRHRIPVINITDLYHPHQDFGDNFDLITPFALPEIDLRAIILDITAEFRKPIAIDEKSNYRDLNGPRDPGFIPVHQLNYLFNTSVPAAVAPMHPMQSPTDQMLDASGFEQAGIDLLLRTLDESDTAIQVTSFGSARPIAVAYNREPELIRKKVTTIHLCAGASSPDFLEWNVALDPHAFVRMLRSDLPVAVYPAATARGPFAYGPHNCFWRLQTLDFIRRMDPCLTSYLAYAATSSSRIDYLRAMDEPVTDEVIDDVANRPHKLWETGVWAMVSNRKLVRTVDGPYRLVPAADTMPTDEVLPNEALPCRLETNEDGTFAFDLSDTDSQKTIYHRGSPKIHEAALREALPALYASFSRSPEPTP